MNLVHPAACRSGRAASHLCCSRAQLSASAHTRPARNRSAPVRAETRAARANQLQPARSAPSTSPSPNGLTEAIEKAGDPSAAVEAYARAPRAEPDNPHLTEAYLRRMVALGAPQLAEKQAEEAVARNPQDGVAWAVLAFWQRRRK